MTRSVVAVIAGYLVFAVSAVLLFQVSGIDPHARPELFLGVLSVVYGMAFAALAGFAAAALAKRHEILHASLVAGVMAVLAIVSLLTQIGEASAWSELATVFAMAPAAVLGGYVRSMRRGVRYPRGE